MPYDFERDFAQPLERLLNNERLARQEIAESPVNNTQQLKAAIALVKEVSNNFIIDSVKWQDFQMCLREIEQRAAV